MFYNSNLCKYTEWLCCIPSASRQDPPTALSCRSRRRRPARTQPRSPRLCGRRLRCRSRHSTWSRRAATASNCRWVCRRCWPRSRFLRSGRLRAFLRRWRQAAWTGSFVWWVLCSAGRWWCSRRARRSRRRARQRFLYLPVNALRSLASCVSASLFVLERPERDFSDALRRPRKRHQPVAQVEKVLDLCVVAGVFERKVDADDLVFA